MANSRQAIKRARQAERRRLHNASLKSAMRTLIKKAWSLLNDGKKDEAKTAAKEAIVSIDRLAGHKMIHANKAARLKSRLNSKLKSL